MGERALPWDQDMITAACESVESDDWPMEVMNARMVGEIYH